MRHGHTRGPNPSRAGQRRHANENPPTFTCRHTSDAQTTDGIEIAIGPDYTSAPELNERADVPKGKVYDFTMSSEDSRIYPGIAKTQLGVVPYKRRVTVYVPSPSTPDTPVPFIVGQDGKYRDFLPTVLDNLIHDKRVPAMVAIMIDSGGDDSVGNQRGLEYDTVSERYATRSAIFVNSQDMTPSGLFNGVRKIFISSAGDVLGKGARRAAKGFYSASNGGRAG